MLSTPERRAVTFVRARLFAIVALAVAVASVWAARVPFFQQPDERAHADYAFALYATGHPFSVAHAVPGEAVTPQTRYLSRALRYRENRYAAYVRMPDAYGTRAYFAAVDRAAPAVTHGVPAAGATLPYVMFSYPAGYYVLAALAMHAGDIVQPGSLCARFFAARFVGVLCLIGTLLLAYGIFIDLRLTRTTAALATFALGLLPLTSWVSGYVQPDVLSTLLLTAAIAASLRWKRRPQDGFAPIALSLALVLLALVKEHYAIATIAATALAAACGRDAFRRPLRVTTIFALPLCALYFAARFSPAGPVVPPKLGVYTAPGATVAHRLADFVTYFVLGLRDVYAGGDPFDDFWLRFGYHPADSIFPPGNAHAARFVLIAASLATFALFAVRQRFVFGRLFLIWRKRSPLSALRLCAGDPIVNVYVFVTVILLCVYALSNGNVWLEGRYWLPVIVPTLAIAIVRNVRLFEPALRRRVGLGLASAWAAYALVGAPLGIAAIGRSFYSVPHANAREPYAGFTATGAAPACTLARNGLDLRVRAGCAVRVTGFAIDGTRGLPATDVFLVVDGARSTHARTGRPSLLLTHLYNDRDLARSGFEATLDTRELQSGRHAIGLAILEADGAPARSGPATIALDVAR